MLKFMRKLTFRRKPKPDPPEQPWVNWPHEMPEPGQPIRPSPMLVEKR
jgi:hypothetical protein